MSRHKFLVFMIVVWAAAVFGWSSGHVFAQTKGTKDATKLEVTRDDVAKYLGKVTPTEQKAAAERARNLGLLPGAAGRTAQAPAAQAPAAGASR
jgi:hypothetical protein